MAPYSVGAAERGVYAKTLVASTVDTVTIARDCDTVEVINEDGAAAISFTVDGTTPTPAGNAAYYLPAVIGSLDVTVPTAGNTVVKVISAGTPKYSVSGS